MYNKDIDRDKQKNLFSNPTFGELIQIVICRCSNILGQLEYSEARQKYINGNQIT